MEAQESLAERRKRCARVARQKGEPDRFRVDRIYLDCSCWELVGDRWAAEAAADLFRKAGLRDVAVNPAPDIEGAYQAVGMICPSLSAPAREHGGFPLTLIPEKLP